MLLGYNFTGAVDILFSNYNNNDNNNNNNPICKVSEGQKTLVAQVDKRSLRLSSKTVNERLLETDEGMQGVSEAAALCCMLILSFLAQLKSRLFNDMTVF